MFQISYFVFVVIVGVVTGLLLGSPNSTESARRIRLAMIVVCGLVLLGFFSSFGFFWGTITVAELIVGVFIGLRLAPASDPQKAEDARAVGTTTTARASAKSEAPIHGVSEPTVLQQRSPEPDTSQTKGAQHGLIWIFAMASIALFIWFYASSLHPTGLARSVGVRSEAAIDVAEAAEGTPIPPVFSAADQAAAPSSSELHENLGTRLMRAAFPEGVPDHTALVEQFRFADLLVLVVGTVGDECHACSGNLSIYYLSETPSGLKLDGSFPNFMPSGSWGAYSDQIEAKSLTDFHGKAVAAITVLDGYSGMGCSVSSLDVVLLLPSGPHLALTTPMGMSNDSDEVTAKVLPAHSPNSIMDLHYSRVRPLPNAETVVRFSIDEAYTISSIDEIPTWASAGC